MGWQYLENEGEDPSALHTANDEEEENALKSLEKYLNSDLTVKEGVTEDQVLRATKNKKICSCGFFSCPLVTRYGTQPPVFKGEIEPIGSQYKRDQKALEINGLGEPKKYY